MPHRRSERNVVKSDIIRSTDEVSQDPAQLFVTIVAVILEEYPCRRPCGVVRRVCFETVDDVITDADGLFRFYVLLRI